MHSIYQTRKYKASSATTLTVWLVREGYMRIGESVRMRPNQIVEACSVRENKTSRQKAKIKIKEGILVIPPPPPPKGFVFFASTVVEGTTLLLRGQETRSTSDGESGRRLPTAPTMTMHTR